MVSTASQANLIAIANMRLHSIDVIEPDQGKSDQTKPPYCGMACSVSAGRRIAAGQVVDNGGSDIDVYYCDPTKPVAVRLKRKHQPPAAPILPPKGPDLARRPRKLVLNTWRASTTSGPEKRWTFSRWQRDWPMRCIDRLRPPPKADSRHVARLTAPSHHSMRHRAQSGS